MRFKNDNDNRYRVNFMRATETLIDKTTVAEFIEHLENNAELEDERTYIYIDGKIIWCKDYVLKEADKLHKEFLVSEDGSRLFYALSVLESAELVDDSTEAAADNTEAINRKERRTMAKLEITVDVADDNILGKIAKVEETRRAFNIAWADLQNCFTAKYGRVYENTATVKEAPANK